MLGGRGSLVFVWRRMGALLCPRLFERLAIEVVAGV